MAGSEVRKGDFVYRNTFFADPGGERRHPRASIAELKALLLPKKGHNPSQDQVAHWYEAQLLHYGLPRTKNKNAAKVRLTSAIASGSLVVPSHIAQLEAVMKREFDVMSRRAKATAKKDKGTDSTNASDRDNRKRKIGPPDDMQENASRTKISVKAGNVTPGIDHKMGTVNETKKRKIASPPKTKQTARKSTGTPTPKRFSKPQTAKKRAVPVSIVSPSPSTSPEYDTFNSSGPYSNHSYTSDESPPSYESHHFDRAHTNSNTRTHTNRLQVSGTYTIFTTPNDVHCNLTLVKDTQRDQFWARFRAADHSGVFHIPEITGITSQQKIYFNWRAEDLNSGQLRFRRDQDGWIQFDGQGWVRGCWNCLLYDEDVEFTGELDGEPDDDVVDLMDLWEWYPNTAYGR